MTRDIDIPQSVPEPGRLSRRALIANLAAMGAAALSGGGNWVVSARVQSAVKKTHTIAHWRPYP